MKMRYSIFLLILLLMSGCQQTPVAEYPGFKKTNTLDESHPQARLVLGSQSLVGKVKIANVKIKQVGKLKQANFAIQNISHERLHLEYRVEWEDEAGFIVDQSGVWRRIFLSPTQIESFLGVGKNPEAEKIVITFRIPHDIYSIDGRN
ncbi:hypothetical protein OLMES_5160 [Oleiphilus messinensis]|uniref:DUF1425 domain-containing protein n=1 Tax=Oleiphilus messinensis TaxID=141451 RepID=A0A1Y0IIC4_9GAMM|nr:DUF1425 domain-containing protein [Oleiphilus messinensis]ARU59144.1 hypothetical protein OLMES_5160 [Oleiphilus messinensis]